MADIKVRIIAEDKASDVLKQTGKAVDDAGKKAKEAGGAFEGLGKTMASVAGGLGLQMGLSAVVGALKNAVVGSFELADALEQATVSFTTMLGSGEAAETMLNDLKSFADKTPFEFMDLQDAAKRLMAMGTAAEDVIPTLTAVGDAAAGLGGGKATIDGITLALGQMGAKGKISTQELNQLTERGIPAMKLLADAAGVSTGEMAKLVEKGLVPAKEGVKVLLEGMKENFGGLMAKQAETASGKLSTMKDAISGLGTEIGRTFIPTVKDGADVITELTAAAAKFLQQNRESNEALLALDEAFRVNLITETEFLSVTGQVEKQMGQLRNPLHQTELVITDMDGAMRLLARTEEDLTTLTGEAATRATAHKDALRDYHEEARTAGEETSQLAKDINATAEADRLAKIEKDAHTASLKLQADMSNLVSGALKEYETDSKSNAKTIADTEEAIKKLTEQHGKSQVAILAGSGTIVDNTTELLKSSLAHRDLKQDVQQLNEKQAAGKISGEDYTLAMDHLNVKILEQEDAHKKLVETQGTGLTALQLAGTEQGNYTTKLGEMNTKLQEAKDADIALQTQIAKRLMEGLVLREIVDAAHDGLDAAEIVRIKATATALGVADSDAVQGSLNTEIAATALADARKKYADAFETENTEGMAQFKAFTQSIASDITNGVEPDMAKAGRAADAAGERVKALVRDYDRLQSKDITIKITTITVQQAQVEKTFEKKGMGLGSPPATAAIPPGMAAGGPVMGAAGTYLVGEMGPELFNPAGNGMIIPNSALGGMGGGGSLRIGTINLYGVQSASELFNQLSKEARARGLQFAVN